MGKGPAYRFACFAADVMVSSGGVACLLACGCGVLFGGLELGVGSWDVVDEGGGCVGRWVGVFWGLGGVGLVVGWVRGRVVGGDSGWKTGHG